MEKGSCPLCKTEVMPLPSHQHYVCNECLEEAVADDGQSLKFTDENIGAGLAAFYTSDLKKYEGKTCQINGTKCEINEIFWGGTYGGVVVSPIDTTDSYNQAVAKRFPKNRYS